MAIYTVSPDYGAGLNPEGLPWRADFIAADFTSWVHLEPPTSSLIVLANQGGGGGETRLEGNNFSFLHIGGLYIPTGGTVFSMERTNPGGSVVFEAIFDLSVSLLQLAQQGGGVPLFSYVLGGDDGIRGSPNHVNYLWGGPGADVLWGEGTAFDYADYRDSTEYAVYVDLSSSRGTLGAARDDTYISIEGVIGSQLFDILTGDGGDNVLRGEDGNDTLTGGGGNDQLIGGPGGDRMFGGTGDDVYYIERDTNSGEIVQEAVNEGFDTVIVNGDDNYSYSLADNAEILILQGVTGFEDLAGHGNDQDNIIRGNSGGNFVSGHGGNDTLDGGASDDFLHGGAGNDTLNGGAGDDNLSGNSTIDEGNDTLDGGAGNDVLYGGAGNDTLDGGAGNDVIYAHEGDDTLDGGGGIDSLAGYGGNDWYYVDNAADVVNEGANDGVDRVFASVSYALTPGSQIEILSTSLHAGTDAINLTGNEFADTIYGNAGNNILRGGAGNDTLVGFGGNDIAVFTGKVADFSIASSGSTIVVRDINPSDGDEGTDSLSDIGVLQFSDRVMSSVSYTLPTGQLVQSLTTDYNFGTAAINLIGNELVNAIFGNAGANLLDGRAGADTLVGFGGDDLFFVDNAGDRVIEAAGGGNDRVFASVNYALGAGQEIEILTTTDNLGTAAIRLTGNELVNAIYGNAGNNFLDGKGGANSMVGFGGDDFYFVDNAGDSITEAAGQGTGDRVFASVSYTLTPRAQIEILSTANHAGTAAINLTGNEFADTIYGNDGANMLDGKGGADAMLGRAGNDWYFVDNAGDSVAEGAGQGTVDRVFASTSYALTPGAQVEILSTTMHTGTAAINLTGNEFANTIYGNDGPNRLTGGLGNDTLVGLGGGDAFEFNTAPHAVNNIDSIGDFTPVDDIIILARGIFSTVAPGPLAASALVIGTAALDADDRIIYNSATGALLYDANGNLAGGATQFATLAAGLALTNADFVVV